MTSSGSHSVKPAKPQLAKPSEFRKTLDGCDSDLDFAAKTESSIFCANQRKNQINFPKVSTSPTGTKDIVPEFSPQPPRHQFGTEFSPQPPRHQFGTHMLALSPRCSRSPGAAVGAGAGAAWHSRRSSRSSVSDIFASITDRIPSADDINIGTPYNYYSPFAGCSPRLSPSLEDLLCKTESLERRNLELRQDLQTLQFETQRHLEYHGRGVGILTGGLCLDSPTETKLPFD